MPRTEVTRNSAPGTRSDVGQLITWLAGDPANNHKIKSTGREALLIRNTSSTTAYSVTVLSTDDANNRRGDVESFSIPANGHAVLGPWDSNGWSNAGWIEVNVTNAALQLAVIVLPNR